MESAGYFVVSRVQIPSGKFHSVAATRRALSLVTLRYERGLSTQLEVLDAQRQLFSAELELASTTRDQFAAVIQLYKALGGGWQSQPPAGHSPSP